GESTTNDVDTGIADLRSGEEASASTDSSSSPDTGADSFAVDMGDAMPSEDSGDVSDGATTACHLAGLTITGDPTSALGARWEYRAEEGGVSYNLAGVLLKPSTALPAGEKYPAVVLSHATGGTAIAVAANQGQRMRGWGLVAISVNLTHASEELIPSESPGTLQQDLGASTVNLQRARKCIDVLASLCDVDMRRVAAHGHSRGAFVTAGLAGTYPTLFKAASHTSGGVSDAKNNEGWTNTSQAAGISIPYQLHHGDLDTTVPLADEQALEAIFIQNGVEHELWRYSDKGHHIASIPEVTSRIRAWYVAHGVL
ncbi:MAG: dienelactone hydrolase family protein, partial [Deltaproteobacteria bacterium]|nr:dienelactone hydrolase family protein [Deltaproteobacteria bacterium]